MTARKIILKILVLLVTVSITTVLVTTYKYTVSMQKQNETNIEESYTQKALSEIDIYIEEGKSNG